MYSCHTLRLTVAVHEKYLQICFGICTHVYLVSRRVHHCQEFLVHHAVQIDRLGLMVRVILAGPVVLFLRECLVFPVCLVIHQRHVILAVLRVLHLLGVLVVQLVLAVQVRLSVQLDPTRLVIPDFLVDPVFPAHLVDQVHLVIRIDLSDQWVLLDPADPVHPVCLVNQECQAVRRVQDYRGFQTVLRVLVRHALRFHLQVIH